LFVNKLREPVGLEDTSFGMDAKKLKVIT